MNVFPTFLEPLILDRVETYDSWFISYADVEEEIIVHVAEGFTYFEARLVGSEVEWRSCSQAYFVTPKTVFTWMCVGEVGIDVIMLDRFKMIYNVICCLEYEDV